MSELPQTTVAHDYVGMILRASNKNTLSRNHYEHTRPFRVLHVIFLGSGISFPLLLMANTYSFRPNSIFSSVELWWICSRST